jgi:hypothetical protein
MKQTRLLLLTLMCLLMSSASCLADDRPIPINQLPAYIKSFVMQAFPNTTILAADMEADNDGIEYEVYLKDGSEIKFDKKSNWEKVECRGGAVPATIVPEAITTYVRTHFPGETITQIERDGNKYEVELSNRLELKFDRNGRFLKIDR